MGREADVKVNPRSQLLALGIAVGVYALLAFLGYLLVPPEQFTVGSQPIPAAIAAMPRWQLAAANAALVIALYGLVALAAYWFARRLGMPFMYREGAGWGAWALSPMLIGLGLGVLFVVIDQILAHAGSVKGFPHPAFPLSLFASGAAGIGEEILFRGFVMGLWAFLLNLILRRGSGRTTALWIGNVIAALAFSASHIPGVMMILNVASPAQLPASIMIEIFLLNSIIGLICGERYMRDGLVGAIGIHLWTDLVWHVLWPLTGLGA